MQIVANMLLTRIYVYRCFKPTDLPQSITSMQATLDKLENWSDHSTLIMNPEKTKTMLVSIVQMSTVHSLKNVDINLTILSKLYFNNIVYNNLPEYLIKRLLRVQKAAVSFVLGYYCTTTDLQKTRKDTKV